MSAGWDAHCGDLWRAHVSATAGRDICEVVGPSPRRPADWAAMMRRLGVRTMDGVISAVHGAPIPRRQAMRGDIVRRGWAIGICRGDKAEFIGGEMVAMADTRPVYPDQPDRPENRRITIVALGAAPSLPSDASFRF